MGIFNFFSQRSTVSQLNQPNSSISMNSNDSLVKIKNFWKSHRQNCSLADTKDASSSDYLIYGSTLLLWAYGDCSPIKNNSEYPIYFSEECNLTNPHKQHLRLVKDEFLGDPSLYGILNSLTIPKLKEILSTIDCKKSGSKQELVDRIIENSGEHTSLNFLNTSDCYGLTDKGKAFLEEHYDYVELHKHQTYNITFHEYVVERQRTEGQIDFFDISFQILSKRISKN